MTQLSKQTVDLDLQVKTYFDNAVTQVQVIPPVSVEGESPIHLVFVVDVSGSMGTGVESTSADGNKESHGFSILDLVKHSLLTIIHSLSAAHFVTLVSFTGEASVVLEGQRMDKQGVTKAEDAVKSLQPLNSTNLWGGLKQGMDCVKKVSEFKPEIRHEVMLFTDGMPNVPPPRGHIKEMQRYMDQIPKHTVRTYGFGYSLDSKLLSEIAAVGNGTFSFIPDAGFVGTIFIHAVADILSLCNIRDIVLEVEGEKLEFVGNFLVAPAKVGGNRHRVELGGVEMGQMRDILVLGQVEKATLMYFDCVSEKQLKKIGEISKGNTDLLKPQMLRLEMCELLQELVGGNDKFGEEPQYGYYNLRSIYTAEKLAENREKVKALIEKYKNNEQFAAFLKNGVQGDVDDSFEVIDSVDENGTSMIQVELMKAENLMKAIMKDLEGQVTESFEKPEYFQKWGEYYLRSLGFAHSEQKRNNFKDFGVQEYGGKVFETEVDRVNDIFDTRPAPEPSNRGHSSGYSAPVSMSMYNNACGPCFAPECLVTMASGVTKACKDIRKGDLVCTGLRGESARVLCVIKTIGDNMVTVNIGQDNLKITPWHPVYSAETGWIFPAEIAAQFQQTPKKAKIVYNFLLEPADTVGEMTSNPIPAEVKNQGMDHTIMVNGVVTCTLGHGITENEVINHSYFGNMEAVLRDLQTMSGWENGFVVLEAGVCCKKSSQTGLVDRMIQQQTLWESVQMEPARFLNKVFYEQKMKKNDPLRRTSEATVVYPSGVINCGNVATLTAEFTSPGGTGCMVNSF